MLLAGCGFQNAQRKTQVMVEHQGMRREGALAIAGLKKEEGQMDAVTGPDSLLGEGGNCFMWKLSDKSFLQQLLEV